jgi:hypothetical protein
VEWTIAPERAVPSVDTPCSVDERAAVTTKTSKAAKRTPKKATETAGDRIRALVEQMKKRKPPKKPPLPKYSEHIVAFVDLLGFRQLVMGMSQKRAREQIADLEWLMQRVVQPYRGPSGEEDDTLAIRVNYFSDCVCFALALDARNLKEYLDRIFWFILHVLQVQGELVFHDRLVRGGIVVDRHYASDRLIFSRAQIHAYDIEQKRALYPHVLVDKSVVDAVVNASKKFKDKPYPFGRPAFDDDLADLFGLLALREDGELFVNYLGFWTELDDEDNIRPFFKRHKSIIVNGASGGKASPSITEKMRALARYHNEYAGRMFKDSFGTIEFKLPDEE